jgi:hypothetical protein
MRPADGARSLDSARDAEKAIVRMFPRLNPNSKIASHADAAIAAVLQVYALSARLWNAPRPLCCGRGQAARWLPVFCNQHDARVRVLRNSTTFYFRIRVKS